MELAKYTWNRLFKMVTIHYISSSHIPSIDANLVHVVSQVYSLKKESKKIFFYLSSNFKTKKKIKNYIKVNYDLDFKDIDIKHLFYPFKKFKNFFIALYAFLNIISKKAEYIISRNLFAAYIIHLINKDIIYECHSIEKGFRKFFQSKIFKCSKVKILVISRALAEDIKLEFKISKKIYILPDCAFDIQKKLNKLKFVNYKQKIKKKFVNPNNFLIGYVGHLYEGRGIEIILGLAKYLKNINFAIVGGNKEDLIKYLKFRSIPNLKFFGHQPHSKISLFLNSMNCLLMPYQRKVSVGYKNSDTSRWMSPIKMFEYMSSNTPVIASNLPVLREVLKNKKNCLLAKPTSILDWKEKINLLIKNKYLSGQLSFNARKDFLNKFTWEKRAKNILSIFKQQNH